MFIGAAVLYSAIPVAETSPSPPEPCGTLDLSSPLTQHCESSLSCRSHP